MRKSFRFLFLLPAWLILNSPSSCQNNLYAGASQASVNPPAGSFIAGHTQNRKFSGIHDSLYAKALVVSDGSREVAFLTLDCIGLLYPQLLQIRELVKLELPADSFDVDHIVLSSTHTHAGPDVVGIWGPDMTHTGVDSTYLAFLVQTAANQVVKAWQSKIPVKASYGMGSHGEEWVYNISQPGELDRSVTTLWFQDYSGRSVASLTNFACHPTFVDAVHDQVSADYVNGFYKKMDEELAGINLFLQGSIGGWVQPEYEAKTFEQAEKRGRELAGVVLNCMQKARALRGTGIRFQSRKFTMPVSNPGFQQLAAIGVIKRDITKGTLSEIAFFTIGNACFATHPGETVPAMELATKKLMKNKGPKFVLGLSMDAMGYILKPEFFDSSKKIPHAAYLCSMSAGPDTGPLVMKIISELAGSF